MSQLLFAIQSCLRFLVNRVTNGRYDGSSGVKELVDELTRSAPTAKQLETLATILAYRNSVVHRPSAVTLEGLADALIVLERWYKSLGTEPSSQYLPTAEEMVFSLVRYNLEREMEMDALWKRNSRSTTTAITHVLQTSPTVEKLTSHSNKTISSDSMQKNKFTNVPSVSAPSETKECSLTPQSLPFIPEDSLVSIHTTEEFLEESHREDYAGPPALLSVIDLTILETLLLEPNRQKLKDVVVLRGRLSYMRKREGSEILKTAKIKILDGKNVGKTMKIGYWSGTVVACWVKDGSGIKGKLMIPRDRIVNVYYSPHLIPWIRELHAKKG